MGQTCGVDVTGMQLLFSLLVFVAFAIIVLYWTVALLARRGKCIQLANDLEHVGLAIAFLVSATSMLGSLYFSEIANYEPCRLCWYQRICMYPIAIVLLVALIRRRRDVVPYVLTLASLGPRTTTWWSGIQLLRAMSAVLMFRAQLCGSENLDLSRCHKWH